MWVFFFSLPQWELVWGSCHAPLCRRPWPWVIQAAACIQERWLGDSGAQAHIWLWLTADILNRKRRFLFYLFIFFLDSIYRSGWPQTHSDPPTFLSTGIKGTHHHTQLRFLFLKSRGPIASQEHMPRYLLGPKLCLSLSHFQNIWGK